MRDLLIAGLAVTFSVLFIWYSRNTGHSFWIYWAPFFLAGAALLLGIPVYRSQRSRMTEPPADQVATGAGADAEPLASS